MVPLLLVGLLKLLKPFGGSWRLLESWPRGGAWVGPRPLALGGGGPCPSTRDPISGPWKTLGLGPWAKGPWPGKPLAGPCLAPALGPGGPWPRGRPLARGALGPGVPWPEGQGTLGGLPQDHEIQQPACLDPSPASWSRNPATRDRGAPGGGARQTLNPKP